MSHTRTSTSINDQTQDVVKTTSACPDFNSEAAKDAKTYATTTMLTYIMGKLEYTYHTFGQSITPTAKEVTKKALQTKFKGLGFNISYNLLYSLTMLSVKDRVEKSLEDLNPGSAVNMPFASFTGGLIGLVVTYPLIMGEALRFEGTSVSKFMSMKPKHFYRGLPAMSISEGIFCATYFGFQPKLSTYIMNTFNLSKMKADYLADASTGIIAMLACNPFYVISSCQKISNKTMLEEASTLYKNGGVKRFFPGVVTLGILGAPLYAMSIGSSSRLSESYDEHRRSLTS